MLLDSDFTSRELTVSFIKQFKYTLESYSRDQGALFCKLVDQADAQVRCEL